MAKDVLYWRIKDEQTGKWIYKKYENTLDEKKYIKHYIFQEE